jgi:DNA-binding protein H-NS
MTDNIDYMTQYAELRAQIAELEERAGAVKKLALAQAAKRIQALMQETGLNQDDFDIKKARKPQDKSTRAPWGSKTRHGQPLTAGSAP